MRGSQPTHLILCHRAGQETLFRLPEFRLPPLPEVIALYEAVSRAAGIFPGAKVAAIALNCSHLNDADARRAIEQTTAETESSDH